MTAQSCRTHLVTRLRGEVCGNLTPTTQVGDGAVSVSLPLPPSLQYFFLRNEVIIVTLQEIESEPVASRDRSRDFPSASTTFTTF
ncbi:hypothetical protein RRG08_043088 [Elysia crispata]|uniref:Uncharacterized protein n=1 Tax=Elysia crispata TaxID=231223 RepID=A0AAE0XY08_9GAST|nr:hypothetical protein RRG08_043088 [Elysia crispata]